MKPTRTCSIDGCERKHYGRGWCHMHYQRWKTHGDPRAGRGKFTDPREALAARTEWRGDCLIWTGGTDRGGYGSMNIKGRTVSPHRFAWEQNRGPIPVGAEIDHTCHNRTCVNPDHLRIADRPQNVANRSGARVDSTTGVRGVRKLASGRFQARVRRAGKLAFIGTFDDIESASAAAAQARKELFGEYAGKG